MSSDPFKTRPEDLINKGLKATIGSLPVVGGPLNEFLTYVIGDPAQERRDDFMRETYEKIEELKNRMANFTLGELRKNEGFQASFIQATHIATRTIQAEKRDILRNAILNSALGTVDENIRQIFMQYIERLTPLHVALLRLYDNPLAIPAVKARLENLMSGGMVEVVRVGIPALANNPIADTMAADLELMKLVNGGALNVMMTAQGLGARRTTDLGRAFIQFVTEP